MAHLTAEVQDQAVFGTKPERHADDQDWIPFINEHFAVSGSLVVVGRHWSHIPGDEGERSGTGETCLCSIQTTSSEPGPAAGPGSDEELCWYGPATFCKESAS